MRYLFFILSFCSVFYATAQERIISTENQQWQVQPAEKVKFPKGVTVEKVKVNINQPLQEIHGFGGSFNALGYKALTILPEEEQQKVMADLFSDEGTAFNLCRMPLGANDFSERWYSFDEVNQDFDLKHFNIEEDKKNLIPYIKFAKKYAPELQVWASPWSPPMWMKHNRHYGGRATNMQWGPLYGDNMEEIFANNRFIMEDRYLTTYANYFSKFISSYQQEGIEIYSVQPQNEVQANQFFPSCVWTPQDLHRFTEEYLIPTLSEDHPEVSVLYGTLNMDSVEYVDVLMKNSKAQGIGVQWDGIESIEYIKNNYPNIEIMQTESECNNGLNNWFTAEHTFDLLYTSFKQGANSYMYWNMILDDLGLSTWMWRQNSMISIDRYTQAVTYNPEYYVMKHFSNLIQKGAHMLSVDSNKDLKVLAFQNTDGSIAIIGGNTTDEDQYFKLDMDGKTEKVILPSHSILSIPFSQKINH
ncbi:glycoside hydrolase family 30 protein [Persicobacter psychrovividus]|uniref:Glycosyl hydrolase n=1 Tax=Persicobacter psychrovividus TaxID=387638 RepID=A0ABN6LK55_9BACT|nr:glycosyl hydrolase [Persicobacter psychrovividus]